MYKDAVWDQVAGKWKQFRGEVRTQWAKLTDDDLEYIAGQRDKLAGKLEAASKSANPDQRRLPQTDRQYVDLIGEAEKGGWLADRALVLSKIKEELGRYRLPHWEKTTISLKVMAMSVVCESEGAQTIKEQYAEHYDSESKQKLAVFGAFSLYLNFVNMFQLLLHFTGQREE